jgi:hypothetical protein
VSRHYVHGLRSVLQGVALPYGYTVTVWSSGQEVIHLRGMPLVWEVFLFAAGAVCGYGALRALAPDPADEAAPPIGAAPRGRLAVLIQIAAIGAAVGAATLIGRIDSSVAWPLVGFSATTLYLAVVSLEPALRAAETSSA